MKKYNLVLAVLLLVFASCSIEEPERDPNLVSKWELIEELYNTGGKAIFGPASRTETVEFWIDSKIKKSSSWCPDSQIDIGEYSNDDNIISVGCGEEVLTMSYSIKGDFLFIYPNCVEACALKYRRIDNLVGFVK